MKNVFRTEILVAICITQVVNIIGRSSPKTLQQMLAVAILVYIRGITYYSCLHKQLSLKTRTLYLRTSIERTDTIKSHFDSTMKSKRNTQFRN